MTALQLYKFIKENNIEWHWADNKGEQDVIIFPYYFQMQEFRYILSASIFDDEGIDITMKDGYFAIWMNYICEYYDVDINEVFPKEK